MAQTLIECPNCRSEILKDYGDKKKLRAGILIFENGKCLAKCPKCKGIVEVPIILKIPVTPQTPKKVYRHVIKGVDSKRHHAI
ncbi:MAG: hypothetical protein JEZ11_24635 [Desulfobacterales bacterium]|nr:hypothetical protein [Desulfobacterales bacterium]